MGRRSFTVFASDALQGSGTLSNVAPLGCFASLAVTVCLW